MDKMLFLESVRAFLEKRAVEWTEPLEQRQWAELFKMASEQNVLPMVYQSVYSCEAFQSIDPGYAEMAKRRIHQQVALQIFKTREFLELYRTLASKGLDPIVVKGIICRNLYPHPDYRVSGDEDIYIPEGTYEEYHRALVEAGMEIAPCDAQKTDILHEIAYVKKNGTLVIEVHKDLFDSEKSAYTGLSDSFGNVFENSRIVNIDNVGVRTMGYTEHMLFLLMHAFKHFIGSGFGIRQVCDIAVYAEAYGKDIDWDFIFSQCCRMHMEVFSAALFEIGEKYLGFDGKKACCPDIWKGAAVDCEDLLDDILTAGVFGSAETGRKHSGNITLNAVSADKKGKKPTASVLKTVFLSKDNMVNRYHYLERYPFLLPAAWADRIFKYVLEISKNTKDNEAVKSIEIGRRRTELMKKYKII